MKPWYEALFTNYANKYDQESFTQGTKTEVDFIEEEMNFQKSSTILDIGCGTGRHAIELARRGYKVTGIDLSENMLNRAREKAQAAGVTVEFLKADARDFHFDRKFNQVIMICEGAFSLMETDEMNFEILKNAANVLAPGGKIIFTCLNALFPLYHSVKDFIDKGTTGVHEMNFDIMQFRDFSTYTITDDNGVDMKLKCNERYFAPSEISFMLKLLGFNNIGIYGAEIGVMSRKVTLKTNHYELLIVAVKE
jgi:ubiquinone/menaquinone biosynthesis C-methylase UbiE